MSHWGWRPLVQCVFICVLVVSCTDEPQNTPTFRPATEPPLTLVLRTPQSPSVTPMGLPTIVTIPQPTAKPTPDGDDLPAPLALALDHPVCYETPYGGVLCLGRITNPYTHPIEHVIVRVSVMETDARESQEVYVTLPQRILPAGGSAPYRALFFNAEKSAYLSESFGGVRADLVRAESPNGDSQTLTFAFENVLSEWVDGVYQVTGELINTSDAPARDIRVVVTLYDSNERVMGFRTLEIAELSAGRRTRVQLNVTPQTATPDLHPALYAEAGR